MYYDDYIVYIFVIIFLLFVGHAIWFIKKFNKDINEL